MRRGTTPSIKISLNVSLEDVKNIYVTIKQENTILNKEMKDLQIQGKEILLKLSQEDTLLFNNGLVSIQVRILMNDGNAFASDIKSVHILDILKDGVIR